MPEFRESLAHYLCLLWFWERWRDEIEFILLGLWADSTSKEAGGTLKGFVQRLDNTCKFVRGSKGGQTALYPPTLRKTSKCPTPDDITTLQLRGVGWNPRASFLDFGSLRLKIAYLTHTSIQFYTRKQWETSVMPISKDQRGKVGLALEFESYFIAFITNDLVFQPTWQEKWNPDPKLWLAPIPPPIFEDYLVFLAGVANWITRRSTGNRFGLACEAMRSAQDEWPGLGVYTVLEVFFDAGVSPFLMEFEVFKCPSRTARICESFFAYAYRSKQHLPSLLKSAMVDGVLAPTQDQRLKYMYWLHVYGKDKTSVPCRMAELVDAHNATLTELEGQSDLWYRDRVPLYDAFEPLYLRDAFENKAVTLGHLIFGAEPWKTLTGRKIIHSDPLSQMFKRQGLLSSTTHLQLACYNVLYPSQDRVFRSTYAYQARKQIWSITRSFPTNSRNSVAEKQLPKDFEEFVGPERTQRLFKSIVTSNGGSVAIGPLEYCGNGHVVTLPSGKKHLSIARATDPTLSTHHIVNQAKREFRLKNNLDAPGKGKKAMTERQRLAQQVEVDKALAAYQRVLSLADVSSSSLQCLAYQTAHGIFSAADKY
ncbi:hypothetical protein GALMADRAFT_161738 [Galerina marginata CBS 339.88]|uniref:Uncharacterized protein n=1 Tax=Galerina marginata (strain CBS 339.88) TaxID=685588 RepID=A0A067S8H4_GALM3|nr:hypothetical protein GALMADRAFT_161738 [Galerina marginata CBS 339.88]